MILKLSDFFAQKKNKKWLYVILIIAVIMLFVSSFPKESKKEETKPVVTNNLEERLEKSLSKMAGVGEVHVVVNYSQTSEKVVAKNTKTNGESVEEEVAFVNSGEVVLFEKLPQIQGIVVICEGGASSAVRTNVLKAVSALTGLSSKSIGVFKGV